MSLRINLKHLLDRVSDALGPGNISVDDRIMLLDHSDSDEVKLETVKDLFAIQGRIPEDWEGKPYDADDFVSHNGDIWEALQDIPLHEPPPERSSKWGRQYLSTRIQSEPVVVSDNIAFEFNNLSSATGEYTNLIWQQGSLNPDVITVNETTGVGTTQVANVVLSFYSNEEFAFRFTPTFTGSSTANWTLTLQYSIDGGSNWSTYSSTTQNNVLSSHNYDLYFTRSTDFSQSFSSVGLTFRWRLRVQPPSGVTLTSYNLSFDTGDYETTRWVRVSTTLTGSVYTVEVDTDGVVKRVNSSDDSELSLSDFPIDRFGTSLPTTNLIANQTFELSDDASSVEVYTEKISRTGETTVGDFGAGKIGVYSNTLRI